MKATLFLLLALLSIVGGLRSARADMLGPVLVIGIAGGSGAGKTELAKAIEEYVHSTELGILHQDSYFLDWERLPKEHYIEGQPNGDHPSAINFDLMIEHIETLKLGRAVQLPRYDFIKDKSFPDGPALGPVKVLIVEGTHIGWPPRLRKLLDYSIFVSADADLRLGRRLKRDAAERGKDMLQALNYYLQVVKPMQAQFVDSTMVFADRRADGEEINGAALEVAAEVMRYLTRVRKKEPTFFYGREVVPHVPLEQAFRGESIPQLLMQQGHRAVLAEGGSLRPPTLDHMGLMIQTMLRFGFIQGKFIPANKYKPGAISNAAALLLSRVAVQHFDEALDANGISFANFAYTPQAGARWEGKDGKQYKVQVDSAEIDIRDPIVEGEDRRTLLAFEALKTKAGGDPKSVFWLAGGDSFASLPKWNSRWQDHLELANWIVVSRPEFDGNDNNVSFESHDPIRSVMPDEVMKRYTYYFDHSTQTHVYENKDPTKPNIYVIRLAKNGIISASSVRTSLSESMDDRLIARAGTIPSVFEACLSYGFFEETPDSKAKSAEATEECERLLMKKKRKYKK